MIPSATNLAGGLLGAGSASDAGRNFALSAFMYKTENEEWVIVPADIIPRYSVTSSKEYTEIPIEAGGFASDHAILRPQIYDVTLHATNTPILWGVNGFEEKDLNATPRASEFKAGGFLALTQAVTAGINAIGSAIGFVKPEQQLKMRTLQGPGKERINVLYEQLLIAWSNSYECKLVVNGRAYDSIFIQSIQNVRDGAAELGTFNLSCKEVIFVTTGESTLRIIDPEDGRNDTKANAGKKAPKQEPPLQDLITRGIDSGVIPDIGGVGR
jgi:hypothetical protein